jgi:hypothetical protein
MLARPRRQEEQEEPVVPVEPVVTVVITRVVTTAMAEVKMMARVVIMKVARILGVFRLESAGSARGRLQG